MGKRWLWSIIAGLALSALSMGAWWQGPQAGGAIAEPEATAAEVAVGEGCGILAGLEPVEVLVRAHDAAPERAGTGYREIESGRIFVPARRLITPLAPGPFGVHWEEAIRTATMLRESNVLSIHFPANRNQSAIAILNGEVVGAEAILCEGRLYAPLRLLIDGLDLRFRWRGARSILVEAP